MTRKNKDNVRTYTPYSNVDVTIEKDENVQDKHYHYIVNIKEIK